MTHSLLQHATRTVLPHLINVCNVSQALCTLKWELKCLRVTTLGVSKISLSIWSAQAFWNNTMLRVTTGIVYWMITWWNNQSWPYMLTNPQTYMMPTRLHWGKCMLENKLAFQCSHVKVCFHLVRTYVFVLGQISLDAYPFTGWVVNEAHDIRLYSLHWVGIQYLWKNIQNATSG